MIISKLKIFILLLLLFSSASVFSQQKNYTFSELRGLEDSSGDTHLFYRLFHYQGDEYNNTGENGIYHWDLLDNLENIFLDDYWETQTPYQGGSSSSIGDYEFWDNDPSKYIYAQTNCGIDCVTSILRFDSAVVDERLFYFSLIPKILISSQNDSILYVSASKKITKSIDGGRNWNVVDSINYLDVLSMSKYNDKEIFSVDINGKINKSIDGGANSYIVDTTKTTIYPQFPEFIYDKDLNHIYRTSSHYDDTTYVRYLSVSNNKGEMNSWSVKYKSDYNIYITADPNESGTIYLADNNKILVSTDFGNSFNTYQTLNFAIVGIFKKSNSDKIYTSTKYNIYEITSLAIKSIKSIVVSVEQSKNEIPLDFKLSQNHPNPFNPTTTINYSVPKASLVTIKAFDLLGREVETLVNEEKNPGNYSLVLNANRLSSGIYFYKLQSGSCIVTRKMVLIK